MRLRVIRRRDIAASDDIRHVELHARRLGKCGRRRSEQKQIQQQPTEAIHVSRLLKDSRSRAVMRLLKAPSWSRKNGGAELPHATIVCRSRARSSDCPVLAPKAATSGRGFRFYI